MGSDQLLAFLLTRPFEPFKITLVNGREIVVRHPEFITPTNAALGVWIVDEAGFVEAIPGEAMISLKTLRPVDPAEFFR